MTLCAAHAAPFFLNHAGRLTPPQTTTCTAAPVPRPCLQCYRLIYGYMGVAMFNIFFFLTGTVALRLLQTIHLHMDAFSFCYLLFNFSVSDPPPPPTGHGRTCCAHAVECPAPSAVVVQGPILGVISLQDPLGLHVCVTSTCMVLSSMQQYTAKDL